MKLANRRLCSGCAACHDICAFDAIVMNADKDGFCYPEIDLTKCVKCGSCTRICPALHLDVSRLPIMACAAMAKDEGIRSGSSSGGTFSLLAQKILSEGGCVYGAAFDRSDWSVRHIAARNEKELEALRGSKYLQSCTIGVYRQVKVDLERGRTVLFSGTPCQIAALRHFLERDWDNLYLVDVVCHGVPSPLVWKKYLRNQAVKLLRNTCISEQSGSSSIREINFRRKDHGWKCYSLSLHFVTGAEYCSVFSADSFMRAFLSELCNRLSCHNCQFRELRSGADLTIGDFWGVNKFHPEMDDDRGTSLVLVNTTKGKTLFEEVCPKMDYMPTTIDEAVNANRALVSSPRPHRNRGRFLRGCTSVGFDCFVDRMIRPSVILRTRSFIARIFRKIGLVAFARGVYLLMFKTR